MKKQSREIVSFTEVYSIIAQNRNRALQEVNNNALLTAWCVGAYISNKIKTSEWGSKVVTELSEYLRAKDPSLKGYSRVKIELCHLKWHKFPKFY